MPSRVAAASGKLGTVEALGHLAFVKLAVLVAPGMAGHLRAARGPAGVVCTEVGTAVVDWTVAPPNPARVFVAVSETALLAIVGCRLEAAGLGARIWPWLATVLRPMGQ